MGFEAPELGMKSGRRRQIQKCTSDQQSAYFQFHGVLPRLAEIVRSLAAAYPRRSGTVSISHARTWGMSCAFAYQLFTAGRENAMLLLDQVKVRRCEARCHIGVTPPRYVNSEARRL
jgi:hypothetical protein